MSQSKRIHQLVRFGALLVTGVSLTYMASQMRGRVDVTEEKLSSITEGTLSVISGIGVDHPVTVHAFISKDVPRAYVTKRTRLLNILREMQATGGAGLTVRIVEPEPFSLEAEDAMENYGIMPRALGDNSSGRTEVRQVFMGLAFVSGPNEEVVPFLDRGLSVEYEVARALRIVTQEKKKVVGILRTDATIMGNFDLQARRQQPAWQIIGELRKQYEVRSLNPKTAIPDDVDVLFVPQLASCGEDELATVKAYVDAGRPTLLTIDPMPVFNVKLAPKEDKLPPPGQGGGGMFGGGGGPPAPPKGDYLGFLREVGVEWADDQIAFDTINPNPRFSKVPPPIVFAHQTVDGNKVVPFSDVDPALDGLSQIVLMYPGAIRATPAYASNFAPLLQTSTQSGAYAFDQLVSRHPLFGINGPVQPRARPPVQGQRQTMAARITGGAVEQAEGEGGHKDRNVVVIADLDLFGDMFFQMHAQGGDIDADGADDVRFDNVPFLLNVVDLLAADERFVELRKRRQAFRRLTRLDDQTAEAHKERQESVDAANASAQAELDAAKKALEDKVAAIRQRPDLDETAKAVMLRGAEATENRRLEAKTKKIEDEARKAVAKSETQLRRAVDKVQNRIRLWSLLIPPIPALLLGILIFSRRRMRERDTIPSSRQAKRPTASPKEGNA